MSGWIDFWNKDTAIYVSERHKMLHYRLVAKDIASLIDGENWTVLDYGCGEAASANIVASKTAKLYLCDAAPNTRSKITAQFINEPKIHVLAPDDIANIADASLDLIIVNSLLQYLDTATLDALLETWKSKLKPDGKLVLADVIPPDVSPLVDASALLSFARQGGFLIAAFAGLVRTVFSDYRKLRGQLGLSFHTESEMLSRLKSHGYAARRLPLNLGHNQSRMLFEARRQQDV